MPGEEGSYLLPGAVFAAVIDGDHFSDGVNIVEEKYFLDEAANIASLIMRSYDDCNIHFSSYYISLAGV
jgi:hypothetical protein